MVSAEHQLGEGWQLDAETSSAVTIIRPTPGGRHQTAVVNSYLSSRLLRVHFCVPGEEDLQALALSGELPVRPERPIDLPVELVVGLDKRGVHGEGIVGVGETALRGLLHG